MTDMSEYGPNGLTLDDVARLERPCNPAQEWAASQPDRSLRALWLACPRGDWLLWLARVAGVDTRAIGYWCAERARKTAIRALTAAGVEHEALRACAPIMDAGTAAAAAEEAAGARAAARAAARAEAGAAWAAWAAEEAAGAAAEAAEHLAIAAHVRTQITYKQIETGLRARLEAL